MRPREIVLFVAAILVAFGAMYKRKEWQKREEIKAIFEEKSAGKPRESKGDEGASWCDHSQRSFQIEMLDSLAILAAALPEGRCQHGPVTLVFGVEKFRAVPVDFQGNEFLVDCHPGPRLVRVFSSGPDGKKNTEDDAGRAYPWVPRSEEEFRELMRGSMFSPR
jgi:hypothetical protein